MSILNWILRASFILAFSLVAGGGTAWGFARPSVRMDVFAILSSPIDLPSTRCNPNMRVTATTGGIITLGVPLAGVNLVGQIRSDGPSGRAFTGQDFLNVWRPCFPSIVVEEISPFNMSFADTGTLELVFTLSSDDISGGSGALDGIALIDGLVRIRIAVDGGVEGLPVASITFEAVVDDNIAPTAVAGEDQSVNEAAEVTLDGSGSSDPDDDTLTYAWTQTGGIENHPVELVGADTAMPTFIAPTLINKDPVELTFTLTVDDGNGGVSSDDVVITVDNVNVAPIADAGEDIFYGIPHLEVFLDGMGSSDENYDALTYRWTQIAGRSVELVGAETATPSFYFPPGRANETLDFELIVNDGAFDSDPDTVAVFHNGRSNGRARGRNGRSNGKAKGRKK